MTGYTTNYAIPYPQGGDSFCGMADLLSDAADAICTMQTTLAALVTRSVDRPTIKVSCESGQTLTFGTTAPLVAFTAVDIDTTHKVDLTADNQSITFPAGFDGVYLTGVQFRAPGINAGGAPFAVRTLDNKIYTGDETGTSGVIGTSCYTMDTDSSTLRDQVSVSDPGAATTVSPSHVDYYQLSLSD